MAQPDNEDFIRAFARGLAVVEAMGRGPSHTLASLSMTTALPRTVVRRLLFTLRELGYVIESEGKGFRLTPKILTLGMTYLSSLPFWGHAQRALETLCAQLGESCALAVFDGEEVVLVLRIPSPKVMSLRLGVGSRLPAYATAPGRVMLGFQSAAFVSHYLEHTALKALTPTTVTDRAALVAALQEVTRTGHAWVDGEFDAHVCGLAVPVRDDRRNVVAAISANVLSGEVDRERALKSFLPALLAAAEQLSGLAPAFLGPAAQPRRRGTATPADADRRIGRP